MIAIRTILRMLRADQRGATAIEYGLIAALIVIAMMAGLEVNGRRRRRYVGQDRKLREQLYAKLSQSAVR